MKSVVISCAIGLLVPALVGAAEAQTATIRQIASTYSLAAIRSGQTVGVGVAVIRGRVAPKLFAFGDSVVGSGTTTSRAFQTDDLFEIASVTKVFTTNLLGQAVHRKTVALDDPISNYATQLGTLKPLTGQITLQQLADFTSGMPDLAPLCSESAVAGCLPSSRPSIDQYTAADFAAFFRQAVPLDFSTTPPHDVAALPAPYFYSNFGVGLLGLLLSSHDAPLGNLDLARWFGRVQREILTPLGMADTYLDVPPEQASRLAGGYQPALARAQVGGGQVTGVTLTSSGGRYVQVPRVHINGGGGTGARATATLGGDAVTAVTLTAGGTGYLTPAAVTLTNGGSTTTASAQIIVEHGQVVAINVKSGGAGYVRVPTVTISGGRATSGRDATATAELVNGRVIHFTVVDGGAGYVLPLSVVIDPGDVAQNAIPIWAPAGALTTTIGDLATFARAAMLSARPAGSVPRAIAEGFTIAETPYACTGSDPDLATCRAGAMRSALSWAVQPADDANGVPAVISKDGSLAGYTTFIALMPDADIAVVAMANSRSPTTGGGTAPAATLANNILYALYAACQSPNGCPH